MNSIVENVIGMDDMTDQVIAQDLLNSIKTGIKSLATALTEAATPDVRQVLRNQLNDALNMHEQFTNYMSGKGWYDAYNLSRQIEMDLQNAQTTLNL
jgi:similar to spore coat protein